MAAERKKVRLGELGTVVTGRTPPGTLAGYFGNAMPFVTPTDMDGRRKIGETARSLSAEGAFVLKRVIIQRGIAVSCIGWQMGKALLIDRPAATNQQINTVVPNLSLADDLFVYYALTARRDAIFRLGAGGSRTPILNKSGFEKVEIECPPLSEQKAIAAVLGVLDDKIELNRRMNATLEAMARALFQSWFVDFDPVRAKLDGRQPVGLDGAAAALFPAAFQDSPAGHVPTSWTVEPVGEVVVCVGGATPSTAESKYWEGGTYHWTTPKDFSLLQAQAPVLIDTERRITSAGVAKISSGLLPTGTLLMSSRAPVGYLAISAIPVAINQGFIAMKCNERASHYFMLNWCQSNMAEIEGRATGTTFAEISKQNFRPIPVVLPPKELMAAFTEKVAPLYARITANLYESRTLATLRDTLLPKLLSGQLTVNTTP